MRLIGLVSRNRSMRVKKRRKWASEKKNAVKNFLRNIDLGDYIYVWALRMYTRNALMTSIYRTYARLAV